MAQLVEQLNLPTLSFFSALPSIAGVRSNSLIELRPVGIYDRIHECDFMGRVKLMNDLYGIRYFFAPLLICLWVATLSEFITLRRLIRPNVWLPFMSGVVAFFGLYCVCWITTLGSYDVGNEIWFEFLQHEARRTILLFKLFLAGSALLFVPLGSLCIGRIMSDRKSSGFVLSVFRASAVLGMCFLYVRLLNSMLRFLGMANVS